jgi:hypothetical protein
MMILLNNPINLDLPTLPFNPDQENMQLVLWQAQMQWLTMVGFLVATIDHGKHYEEQPCNLAKS